MSVIQAPQVKVDILTMSLNFAVNTVMGMFYKIAHERGLSSNYMNDLRKVIEDGMYTWFAEQTLLAVVFEVSVESESAALERFTVPIAYSADPNTDVQQPPMEQLVRFMKTLKPLPPDAKYRVLVELAPGASQVAGWVSTTAKEINITQTERFDDWVYGNIGLTMVYQGSEWNGEGERRGDSREKVARI